MGGGGFSTEPRNPFGDAGGVVAARGDDEADAAAAAPRTSGGFDRRIADLRAHVLAQDVAYVGGGNTASLLAARHAHGLDGVLTEGWHAGVVLCGVSAGMNCWFEQSLTDSFDSSSLAALRDGPALLPGSACPRHDGEPLRRPTYRGLVGAGELHDGWAADDGAALVFAGIELEEVVASRPDAAACRLQRTAEGVDERRVPARLLGAGT